MCSGKTLGRESQSVSVLLSLRTCKPCQVLIRTGTKFLPTGRTVLKKQLLLLLTCSFRNTSTSISVPARSRHAIPPCCRLLLCDGHLYNSLNQHGIHYLHGKPLSLLPFELRLSIYDKLALNLLEKVQHKSSLQQTSRQLYNELSHHFDVFWSNTTLQFNVSSTYKHKSWLGVTSMTGFSIGLEDTEDALSRGFQHIPYSKLKAIIISISAPDRTDPGQILNI